GGCDADHRGSVTQGTDGTRARRLRSPCRPERYRRRSQEEPAGAGRGTGTAADGRGYGGSGGVRTTPLEVPVKGAVARDQPASLARPAPSRPERAWPSACPASAAGSARGETLLDPAAEGVADGDMALLDEPGDVAVDVQGHLGGVVKGGRGRAEEGDHGHALGRGLGRRPQDVLGAAAGGDGHQQVPPPAEPLDLAGEHPPVTRALSHTGDHPAGGG